MLLRLQDIVKFQSDRLFQGAVSIDWFLTGADSALRRYFLSMQHRHSQGVHHRHIELVYTDSRKHPIVLT